MNTIPRVRVLGCSHIIPASDENCVLEMLYSHLKDRNIKFCRGEGREAGELSDVLSACGPELIRPIMSLKSWLCSHRWELLR